MSAAPMERPRLFAPGMQIGMHLQVERVVRETPNRSLYLVNNAKRRWYAVKCWECGNKHSPASAQACTYCSAPLGFRRLLMSSRWEPGSAKAFVEFANRRIKARTVASPVALYGFKGQLLSFFRWNQQNLLINVPAPLPPRKLLIAAFQLSDALQRLHDYGVVLGDILPTQVLIRDDGSSKLFDLEVDHLERKSIERNEDPTAPPMRDVRRLAAMLDDYCPVEAEGMREFFTGLRRGSADTADEAAALVASWARRHSGPELRSRAGALTDTGLVQYDNEDAWSWRPLGGGAVLYAAADGCSGPQASGLAVRTVSRLAARRAASGPVLPSDAESLVKDAFAAANKAVRAAAQTSGLPSPSDTTLALAVTAGDELVLGTTGDTYAWVLRGSKLQPLGARDKRVALLGGKAGVTPQIERWKCKGGDRLLLGTRGLWAEVSEDRLANLLLTEPDPRAAVRRLVRAANDSGGRENITAVVVDL